MDYVQILSLSAFLSGRMCPIKRKWGELNLICPAVKAVIELPKKTHSYYIYARDWFYNYGFLLGIGTI